MQIDTLCPARRVVDEVANGLRIPRARRQPRPHRAVSSTRASAAHSDISASSSSGSVSLIDKHAVSSTVLFRATGTCCALAVEQMHVCRLEQVVIDLVEILNLAYEVGADVFLAAEALETTPHADKGVGGNSTGAAAVLAFALCFRVDPLLDVDGARAVVDLVRDVGRLRLDRAHLAHDGHLGYGVAIDGGIHAGVGVFPVEELLDGYGAEGFVGVLFWRRKELSVHCVRTGGREDERVVGLGRTYLGTTALTTTLLRSGHEATGITTTISAVARCQIHIQLANGREVCRGLGKQLRQLVWNALPMTVQRYLFSVIE